MVNNEDSRDVSEWDETCADPKHIEQTSQHLAALFGATTTPLMLVDTPDLRVIVANAAARSFLAKETDVRISNGRLLLGDAAGTDRFKAHLAATDSSRAVWPTASRDGGYVVLAVERSDPRSGPILLTLSHSERSPEPLWSDLTEVFGLTRAEDRLAKALVAGHDVEALSTALGITIETARTHIKRIYTKVGVGSREQLLSTLLPFRVP